MYIIRRTEDNSIIAATHTKMGAKNACRHYHRACALETNSATRFAKYEKIDNYSIYKWGYALLRFVRRRQNKKLEKFKAAEYECRSVRRAQQKKVSSLY